MILYFSGTGNSEYAAKRIAAELQDEAVNLFHKIRRNDCSKINSDRFKINVKLYVRRTDKVRLFYK